MARSSLPPPNSRIAPAKPALERPQIIRLASVDSTQRYAAMLATDGAADGTAVVAETQTAGRGRRGRLWRDTPGASLLVSVILRTSLPLTRVPTLSLAAGVAVAEALITMAGVEARLKWPNDVLVNGRKIAGVLLERQSGAVILGIGINIAAAAVPAELTAQATSVAGEGGRADRVAILAALLDALADWRACLEREGFEPVRARWTALAAMLGRRITADGVVGMALGLDDDGALLMETGAGTTRILAGDVHM
jgi:BirA family biotin operon repressor/biotin-[acetyl-CoA-carboxylase] ligase